MLVGVLALQGDFREHVETVRRLGHEAVEVRESSDLERLDALVIPGGESTTIGRLASIYGLIEPLRERIEAGLVTFGTCAGMIFLAAATTGRAQPQLGVLDVVVQRNAFGRQIDSFETDLDVEGLDSAFRAVFIRAPWIEKVGAGVEVLATVPNGEIEHPVLVRQGNILAASFHPELTHDPRLHELALSMVEGG